MLLSKHMASTGPTSPAVTVLGLLCTALASCVGSSGSNATGPGVLDSTATTAKPPDPAARTDLAAVCVESINGYRGTLSLPPLGEWTDSAVCFSRQADLDAKAGKAHGNFGICKESAQNTCPGWFADEAVGGPQAAMKRCMESMWNEGPGADYAKHGHYINMTNTRYTKVGCGFHVDSGSVWINMDFK